MEKEEQNQFWFSQIFSFVKSLQVNYMLNISAIFPHELKTIFIKYNAIIVECTYRMLVWEI